MCAKNTCDCPDPPGGRAVCESNQVAVCTVEDGRPVGICITPPVALVAPIQNRGIRDPAVRRWLEGAIRQYFGDRGVKEQFIFDFIQGRAVSQSGNIQLTFRLPGENIDPGAAVRYGNQPPVSPGIATMATASQTGTQAGIAMR